MKAESNSGALKHKIWNHKSAFPAIDLETSDKIPQTTPNHKIWADSQQTDRATTGITNQNKETSNMSTLQLIVLSRNLQNSTITS